MSRFKIRSALWSVLLGALLAGCTHRLHFTPHYQDKLDIPRIIHLRGVDMIDNLTHWKLKADVKNQYPGDSLFYIAEVRCLKGTTEGKLALEYYPTNAIHLKRGQVRKIAFTCNFPASHASTGVYTLIIPRIFHNPLGDGETTDKVIARNVVWKLNPGRDI